MRTVRTERGLTQVVLAERSGITQSAISAIERDEVGSPSFETVVRLARALAVPPEELFPVPSSSEAA